MAELNNTSDISTLLSNYQSGTIQQPAELEVPEIENNVQVPDFSLVDWIEAGPEPIIEYNNENKLLEAAQRGWGESRFDKGTGYQSDRDIEDLRASAQHWTGKITNGLLKMGTTALSTAANSTVGMVAGLGSSVFGMGEGLSGMVKSGVNNPVSEWLTKDFTDFCENLFPNYRTEEERSEEWQQQWWKHINANFVGDSLIKNFGFTLGAIGGGMAWNKLASRTFSKKMASDLMRGAVSAAEKNPAAAKYLTEAADILKNNGNIQSIDWDFIAKNCKEAGKTLKNARLSTQLFGAVTAAMGEGTVEGLMAKDEFFESFIPKMNQQYEEAYNSLGASFYEENKDAHPEWFGIQVMQDENGVAVEVPVIASTEGMNEFKKRQLELADKYNKTMEYAQAQGEVLAKTTFLLNLPVLMTSDLIQFGRLFGGDWTTARRNAPKVKGTFGEYTDAVGNEKLNALLGSLKVAGTEASEEMIQGFVSSGAQNIAETRLTYYKDLGYDDEATREAVSGMSLLLQGGKDYLGDAKNWQEGVIGALTGLFGIPGRHWNGGAIGEIQRAKAEKAASSEAAATLNRLANDKEFSDRWRSHIRHLAFDKSILNSVENNDFYAYQSKNSEQLIGDILAFADAGRIEDFKDFVEGVSSINPNDTEAVEDIKQFLRESDNEDNIRLANRPASEIVGRLHDAAQDVQTMINDYYDVFTTLADVAPEDVNTDRFKEMMFTSMQLRSYEDNFFKELGKTLSAIKPYLSVKAAMAEDGAPEKDSSKISARLETLQSQYLQAFSGGLRRNSVLDVISRAEMNSMLDAQENEIKKMVEDGGSKLTTIELQSALDSIKHMRKLSDTRRALIDKFVTLRDMSNEEFDSQAMSTDKKLQQAEKKQAEVDTSRLQSVNAVRLEMLRRDGQDREDYVEYLKSLRDENEYVSEFLDLEDLGDELDTAANKQLNNLNIVPNEASSAKFILNYMQTHADSVQQILDMDPSLLPSVEQVNAFLGDKVTSRRNLSPDVISALDSANYEMALQDVLSVINEVRESRELTQIFTVPSPVQLNDTGSVELTAAPSSTSASDKKPSRRAKKSVEYEDKQKAASKAAQSLIGNVSEGEVPSTDPPAPASDAKPVASVEINPAKDTPKALLTPGSHDTPEIPTPSPVAMRADETVESIVEDSKDANTDSAWQDVKGNPNESGDSQKRRDNYNMSVPEKSPEAVRSKAIFGKQRKDSSDIPFPNLPDEPTGKGRKYETVWNTLKNKYDAFNNADKVRLGDDVYFFIDDSLEQYDGEPQILMGIKRNGNVLIYNILRKNVYEDNVFSEWRGLEELRAEIINEYKNWVNPGDGSFFEFSKHSNVWARQSGFVQFVKSVDTEEGKRFFDRPISGKEGFSKDAPIIAIDPDGNYVQLAGREIIGDVKDVLPTWFKAGITERLVQKKRELTPKGNLYYLAAGADSSYIPIRLNVEHFTPSNYSLSGYGFDEIRKLSGKLASLANRYSKDIMSAIEAAKSAEYETEDAKRAAIISAVDNITASVREEKSELLQSLGNILDIHGLSVTVGLAGDENNIAVPTIRFGVYQGEYDKEGHFHRGSIDADSFSDFIADSVTEDKVINYLASLRRPFNVRFYDTTKEGDREAVRKSVSLMASEGLLTSNSETMRAQGIDIYINSFNPKTRQFDDEHSVKIKRDTSEKKTVANPGGEGVEGMVVSDSVQQEQAIQEAEEETVETVEDVFSTLDEATQKRILNEGFTKERFNKQTKEIQDYLIRC